MGLTDANGYTLPGGIQWYELQNDSGDDAVATRQIFKVSA